MWIIDFNSEKDNPLRTPPFVPITHLCYSDILPAWEYPWHSHTNDYELSFITYGSGSLIINEKETPVNAGDICVIPPGTYHRHAAPDPHGMEYLVIRFRSDPMPGSLSDYFRSIGPAVTSGSSYLPYIKESANLLLQLQVSNGGVADVQLQTVCLSLIQLVRMLSENKALAIRTRSDYSMNDILRYITEHCEDHISLQSLSEKFSISSSHLSRMFSHAYGCSPINYLINARMARATEYLGKTNKSISEISELVGYENHFYFTNLFIKRIGCSPTEYRERMANRDVPKTTMELSFVASKDSKG